MASEPGTGTIDPKEAAHFGAQAADWWDPHGSSAMLHKLNPVRLRYIREAIDRHWDGDPGALKPLAGKRALDIGCGAGLVAEPLCRLGADVTAIDAAPENIDVASAHAVRMGLPIDYRACGVEALHDAPFDLITALEVLEHVTDPALFIGAVARLLRPDGLLILSTPNRTSKSKLLVITLAEGFGQVPRGTHDWHKFLTPDETANLLGDTGLTVTDTTGIVADPRYGFTLSRDLAVNYILSARKSIGETEPTPAR
ncbi:bifunctional 2-polyprenyl-6-hydroxyphenol methylase/3-demethylubiquinol 3-O-methyltransferase UbiG [Sphingobium nicotianae]|uniref:Ubiquinone biosynthesis O-methyltransferase n=1 Tax=Sphingobium nicotianae TaxID=2782607 RepID=A0A9X1D9K5_9SPHN|nr:bifunctional 2-polyprenyl-6-hydroxyphenol methylase/3-demethylubiquinol 3-O-methyltransferase UbiG [Sphingobium nicotianae]MBT2185435.1 bifunctional 2-polyprenyl-6-hydroxyphenol methylase/3-demethylubiquinol 3-O-methyltransferase UbiG [Sphingobium nicotianae]